MTIRGGSSDDRGEVVYKSCKEVADCSVLKRSISLILSHSRHLSFSLGSSVPLGYYQIIFLTSHLSQDVNSELCSSPDGSCDWFSCEGEAS